MKAPRLVTIESTGKGHFVRYVDRQKHGRHCAAIFAPDVKTRVEVQQWVLAQHGLRLAALEYDNAYCPRIN